MATRSIHPERPRTKSRQVRDTNGRDLVLTRWKDKRIFFRVSEPMTYRSVLIYRNANLRPDITGCCFRRNQENMLLLFERSGWLLSVNRRIFLQNPRRKYLLAPSREHASVLGTQCVFLLQDNRDEMPPDRSPFKLYIDAQKYIFSLILSLKNAGSEVRQFYRGN